MNSTKKYARSVLSLIGCDTFWIHLIYLYVRAPSIFGKRTKPIHQRTSLHRFGELCVCWSVNTVELSHFVTSVIVNLIKHTHIIFLAKGMIFFQHIFYTPDVIIDCHNFTQTCKSWRKKKKNCARDFHGLSRTCYAYR